MNNNAKEWVKALRSGQYKQGRDTLRSDDEYCCLGVACDLAVEAGVIPEPTTSTRGRGYSYGVYGDRNSLGLPNVVREWLGLSESSGAFTDTDGSTDFLSNMNDRGTSFEIIADIIESEPKGLFVEETE